MPRGLRRESDSGIHHVMNRGVDHQPVFFADADRVEFGRRLAAVHDELGVAVLAYCLMDNHFHLLLRTPEGTLSEAMRRLLSLYTRHTNDRTGRDGPLFRGRFHSIPVETDAYLLQASRYIHRNPLDLPGIASPREHRWSSYRTYLGLRPAPPFVDIDLVTDMSGGRDALASFTEGAAMLHRSSPSIEDVRQLVECAVAVDDLAHPSPDADRSKLSLTVMVLLADRCRDPSLHEVLSASGARPSTKAEYAARRRARQRLGGHPNVGRVLRWVEAELARYGWGQTPSVPRA